MVADIKTRYTLIRSPNGREAIVPNEKVITERVENLSLADPRMMHSREHPICRELDGRTVRDVMTPQAREDFIGTPLNVIAGRASLIRKRA